MNAKSKKRPIRKKLNITYDSIEFFKLTRNRDFLEDVKSMRDECDIYASDPANPIIKHGEEITDERKIYEYMFDHWKLQPKIYELLKKFKLSENWYQAVFEYILLDRDIIIDAEFKPDKVSLVSINYSSSDKDYLWLQLGKDSTLEEIIARWPDIQKSLKRLSNYSAKRRKPSKVFFRDYLMHRLHLQGKTPREISEEMRKEYGYGFLDYGVIKTNISRFKKRYKPI